MWRLALVLVCLVSAGCAAPPSNGGLWAQQGLDQELAMFRLSDQQRIEAARAFELQVADELLMHERTRLEALLASCPGATREPMTLSTGNRVRDVIRIRAGDDQARLASVARLALADWRLRRARVNRNPEWCDEARAALGATSLSVGIDTSTQRAISEYALGLVDVVQAEAPLPRYLAVVYGGSPPDATTPEDLVDQLAPAYPQYEPDALWLSLPT